MQDCRDRTSEYRTAGGVFMAAIRTKQAAMHHAEF